MRQIRYCMSIIFFVVVTQVGSTPSTISVHFKEMDIVDAIHYLAKYTHHNVFVSKEVTGKVSFSLQKAPSDEVFLAFLELHHLAKQPVGQTWIISPEEILIKSSQTAQKWQAIQEAAQPLQAVVWPMRYAKAETVATIVGAKASFLSERGHVHVDQRTNALCIQDVPERIAKIKQLLTQLDVPIKQIRIEARLASIDRDEERALGLSLTQRSTHEDSKTSDALSDNTYHLAVATLVNPYQLDVTLAALEQNGKAELISKPTLFTADQQPASIEAGEEVPYQEVSRGGGTAVVFKKAVLGLKVTPHVLPDNQIRLSIQLNHDRPNQRLVQGVPTISTRQLVTSVLVKNGQTVVLGGIYELARDHARRRIPLLGDLPLLGRLFELTHTTERQRELLVFVTPRVMIEP